MSNFDPTMAARVRAERARAELEDDVDTLSDGTTVLKDGHALRVPMFLADGTTINPKLTFEQRLVAQKVQQDLRDKATATRDAEQQLGKGGRQTFSDADARRYGLADGRQLHRPGFRFNGADPYARDSAIIALADYDAAAESAWKTPTPLPYTTEVIGEGSKGPVDPTGQGREGDSCRTNTGERGRKVDMGDGRLICVPEPHVSDYLKEGDVTPAQGVDGLSARDAARIEYEDNLCNAWRNPAGSAPVLDSVVPAPQRLDPTKDVATMAKDHQRQMNEIYAARDQELEQAYKTR
jgi:hypothetical protein